MKRTGIIILLISFLIGACETDPVFYMPGRPVPIIYAIFDDHDTTHRILVTKSFGAEKSPAEFGFMHDSLYWKNIEVEVRLKEHFTRKWIVINAERVHANNKDSGLFLYPEQEYFEFHRVILDTPAHPLLAKTYGIDSISVRVSIPGYEDAGCQIKRIDSLDIVTPLYYQTYLYLTPSTPLLFIWAQGHPWSEFDATFEIIEELESGYRSKWVHIQNSQTNESFFNRYRQINITYDEFIREVLLQIEDDPAVIRRYLGIVNMKVVGGDAPMVEYMKFLNGYTDYNSQGYTNITNGLGIMATTTLFIKDSMSFDYETRKGLINENKLRKLRISQWTGSS